MPTPKTAKKSAASREQHIVGMRVPIKQLAEIDRRAKRHHLNRTEYMIRAALGEPLNQSTLEQRVTELEQRVERLER